MKKRNIKLGITTLVAAVAAATIYFTISNTFVVISGQLVGTSDTLVYVDTHNGITRVTIDTLTLPPNGNFRFKIEQNSPDPALYELRCGDERVPIFAKKGERIKVNSIGNIALNYTISGSQESELLRTFYQQFISETNELKAIASEFAATQHMEGDTDSLALRYNEKYQAIKHNQIKFTIANKGSLAAVYAVMQLLPGDRYLINENSDLIYYRTIADAVEKNYPESRHLAMLRRKISDCESRLNLLDNVRIANYPDINLPDRFGKMISLSSLSGKVILLDFWSPESSVSNQNNAVLKELYESYKADGFEIYQVGANLSKSQWISAIQQQRLPWIGVNDFQGENSLALRLYNVSSLPSNVLISKSGEIVGHNIFGEELRNTIERESRTGHNEVEEGE